MSAAIVFRMGCLLDEATPLDDLDKRKIMAITIAFIDL